jgi:hypothetical protein
VSRFAPINGALSLLAAALLVEGERLTAMQLPLLAVLCLLPSAAWVQFVLPAVLAALPELSAALLVRVLLKLLCRREECRVVGKKKLSLDLGVSPAVVAVGDEGSAKIDSAGLLAIEASLPFLTTAVVGPAELLVPVPQDSAPPEPLLLLRGEPRGEPGEVSTPLGLLLAAVAQVLLSKELLMPLTSIGWLWLFLMPCSCEACSNALQDDQAAAAAAAAAAAVSRPGECKEQRRERTIGLVHANDELGKMPLETQC